MSIAVITIFLPCSFHSRKRFAIGTGYPNYPRLNGSVGQAFFPAINEHDGPNPYLPPKTPSLDLKGLRVLHHIPDAQGRFECSRKSRGDGTPDLR